LLNIVSVKSLARQRLQRQTLFGKSFLTTSVGVINDLLHQCHVLITTGEVAATAKQERLLDAIFEVPVLGFDITVLVSTPSVGFLSDTAVVVHQGRVASGQQLLVRMIADRSTERVGAMLQRHAAEFPESVLNSLAERLE
jgi:hypothetical protein